MGPVTLVVRSASHERAPVAPEASPSRRAESDGPCRRAGERGGLHRHAQRCRQAQAHAGSGDCGLRFGVGCGLLGGIAGAKIAGVAIERHRRRAAPDPRCRAPRRGSQGRLSGLVFEPGHPEHTGSTEEKGQARRILVSLPLLPFPAMECSIDGDSCSSSVASRGKTRATPRIDPSACCDATKGRGR